MKWTKGRQNTGYEVLPIFISKWLKADCYVLRYKKGSSIPKHKDECKDSKHYRLNIEIWKANKGGVFKSKCIWSLFNRIHFFRPDLEEHEVSEIEDGIRYVLSIGKVI